MADLIYACTSCGRETPRDKLTAKRVVFYTMGDRGKMLRSRTVEWLCGRCRQHDPDWNREKSTNPRGFATNAEKVEATP